MFLNFYKHSFKGFNTKSIHMKKFDFSHIDSKAINHELKKQYVNPGWDKIVNYIFFYK